MHYYLEKMAMKVLMLKLLLLLAGSHLNLANHDCSEDESCNIIGQFEIDIEMDGKEIDLAWKFNRSKPIFGFQTVIYNSDNSIIYESPLLHHSERFMKLERELRGTNKICVKVYENSTKILAEKCEVIKITDLKIVIGILAGTIFLIPCIVVISYVIYKDYKVAHLDDYEKLDLESEGTIEDKVIDNIKNASETDFKTVKTHKTEGNENKAYVIEDHFNQILEADKEHIETHEASHHEKDHDSDLENEKSVEKHSTLPEGVPVSGTESSTKYESNTHEVINEAQTAKPDVTEDEISGTSL